MSASSNAATAGDRPAPVYLLTPTESVVENPLNPRKRFDLAKLEELAASIQQAGIIEPLVVRLAKARAGRAVGYELIAGARRLRAAKLAGVDQVPVLVRTLTDAQVLELMVIENNQREDVHPLEEADGYATLQKIDPAYTPEAIAAKVGRSTSYIYRRLKLRELVSVARKAFEADELTAAHAERLARLTKAQQEQALKEVCFYPLFGAANRSAVDQGPGRRDIQPVSKLDEWIAHHVRLQVDSADVPAYFPELAAAQAESKTEDEGAAAAPRLLELSESHQPGGQLGQKHGSLPHGRWVEIGSKSYTGKVVKPCEHAERGVVVHGGPVRVLTVCATKGCPVHWPERKKSKAARTRATADASRQRGERENAERERQPKIREAFGRALNEAINEKASSFTKLDSRVLRIAARHVFSVKSLTARTLPAAIIHEAVGQYGFWDVDNLSKIAKAIGINPKPLQAAAEAKFPKPAVEKKS